MPVIEVENLRRDFSVVERKEGLRGALASIVHRRTRTVTAVDGVSFGLDGGRVVGFLGPNGSGKTTTLKCIAGLLTPTAGRVSVNGFVPQRRERAFLRNLGFVMGQKWQLHIDLPVGESYELSRVIYDIQRAEFAQTRDDMVDLLDLGDLLDKPARKLSLGQRMRCEFAAALLHRPSIVLLDEPTIGLDFEVQSQIRQFIKHYVEMTNACVLLTSHYLADIEALCQDVMTISQGRITFTGSQPQLRALAGRGKRIAARLTAGIDIAVASELGKVVEHSAGTLVLEVDADSAPSVLGRLQSMPGVVDLSLSHPPLEETLRVLYAGTPAS